MGPLYEFYQAEQEYRREMLRDVGRAKAARKANRLRALLLARRAERDERETLVRAA
jgi:hypothetical protein